MSGGTNRNPVCAVDDCTKNATVIVGGRLRLNPHGKERDKWIAVEFALCPEHEMEHDKFHGGPLPEDPPDAR